MNSFIIIEGLGLWLFFILFFFVFLAFIMYGIAYINAVGKNERLKQRNLYLRRKLALTEQEYYKATFKLPEVDDVQMQ